MSPSRGTDRGGFVLAFVVFMLFAVSVAAATGYLVVSSEFSMAKHATDGAEALSVARAGLERFVAEQIGVVDDTVSYALGDGIAVVTSRKLFAQDSVTDMYYIKAEATVADVRTPSSPARRVVGAYAVHRRRPIPHHSTVMVSANEFRTESGGTVRGFDQNSSGDCQGGGADPITGAIARYTVSEDVSTGIMGAPEAETWSGGFADMVDSTEVRWDVLTDPDFPIEFDGTWPNYGSLPADSFPVVRWWGGGYENSTGRGVLIMPGMFDPQAGFYWEGIILAGGVDDWIEGTIRGLLVGGLDADNPHSTVRQYGSPIEYFSCHVYAANESISYLELVENTVFEAN